MIERSIFYALLAVALFLFLSEISDMPKKMRSIYIGDSLCSYVHKSDSRHFPVMAGIESDCSPGRALMDYGNALPDGYDVIFIAMATNDSYRKLPIDDYRQKLSSLVSSSTAKIYCVLPLKIDSHDTSAYRDAMIDICPFVVNPAVHGVVNGSDGIHWQLDSHLKMADLIKNIGGSNE